MITAKELREKYFSFFESKGHKIIKSASLIPENDPTVLFTTAGMHPLVPYLLGEPHPAGKRLVDVQKCVRTGDIEDVGDNTHLTFFEMLGNWSLGDYFKKDSIAWSWEFLTSENWLNINPEKFFVTVYEGDEMIEKDEESIEIWKDCFSKSGIEAKVFEKNSGVDSISLGARIFLLPAKDNFWGPAGKTGPCGPDTEIFFDTGKDACSENCAPGCSCGKFVEIWNNVFMQYNKKEDSTFESLSQKNVDTGMGVERTVAILNGYNSVFECDTIKPLIEILKKKSCITYDKAVREYRIISDHIRAAVMMIGDGVVPSNKDQGYVLRRLIRRLIRHWVKLSPQVKIPFHELVGEVCSIMSFVYAEVSEQGRILDVILNEQEKFEKTLLLGIKKFNDISSKDIVSGNKISGKDAFDLFQSYGFPLEMTEEMALEKGLSVDSEGFLEEMKSHQETSRTSSVGKFKGGLADDSEQTSKYHTAAHLMLAGLRKVLGEHVSQKGSNITSERIRFDFSHPEKVSVEKLREVEDFVNAAILKDCEVLCSEMNLDDARDSGALGIFDSKYGDIVKVYKIGEISNEICGGPHAQRTGCLGKFKIIKEESASAGVRRIKAVLEN